METVNIFSPSSLDYFDSYGLLACQLGRYLYRNGVYPNFLPGGNRLVPGQPEEVRRIINMGIRYAVGGFLLGYPTAFDRYSDVSRQGTRVAVTMFESSRLPPGWVEVLNTLDAVIVPSSWCKRVFIDSGTTVPVYDVPLGINDVYKIPKKRKRGNKLRFLAFGDRGRRKGSIYAIAGFVSAFGDSSDVELVIKARKNSFEVNVENKNITVIREDMDEDELLELYYSCDVLIQPSFGEGFGLIPREFAATGGISLATGWSGLADHIDLWGWPLDYTLVVADWFGSSRLNQYGKDGLLGIWAKPDVIHLADRLVDIYENFDRYAEDAYNKADWCCSFYSWDKFARTCMDIYRAGGVVH